MEGNRGVADLAALSEPNRRRIYQRLSREHQPVSRRDLSKAVGIGENLLTFHLDRLIEAGLVRVVAASREPGRRGRPARLYEAVSSEVAGSVPPRRYDLVAEVLALAEREQRSSETFQAAAERVAASYGAQLARQRADDAPASDDQLNDLLLALGYEPCDIGGEVVLDNCPFDRLREVNTPLVCGVNHALVQGYLDGLGISSVSPRVEPTPDRCCVVLSTPALA